VNCKICGREMVLEVLHNHSGCYLGYVCDTCSPQTRETCYFITPEEAEYEHSTFKEV
jgi:hypothetical protein